MPTILHVDGFALRIYTHDHPPPHVHVLRESANLKVYLDAEHHAILQGRMSRADVAHAIELVATHRDTLVAAWYRIDPQP